MSEMTCENTDVKLWEEPSVDFHSHFHRGKIFVTRQNGIGIECGGHAIVAPLKTWHESAKLFIPHNLSSNSWRWKVVKWLLKPNRPKIQFQ